MELKNLAIQLAFAGLSLAQLEVIQGSITKIQGSLTKLDTAVKALTTDPLSAAGLLTASQDAQATIKQATTDITAADSLSLIDALQLQQTAGALTSAVQTSVGGLAAKKSTLDQLGVTQIAVQALKDQKTASTALGDAIVSKVPAIGRGIAGQSLNEISAAVDQAIATLSAAPKTPAAPAAPAKPATPATPANPVTPAAPVTPGCAGAPAAPAARFAPLKAVAFRA